MKKFMDEDFLLTNTAAINLYNTYAKDMPIIDYHCHLSPREIFENKKISNITVAWLQGDHYKWKAMRTLGIDEKYITGDGGDYEKFLVWAKTVSKTYGNPLYHWTHLELRRYFGVDDVLNERTAPEIWEKVNALLAGDGYRPRDLIRKSGVECIFTTDDPADTLEYHKKLKECKEFEVKVCPAFRPDKALGIQKPEFVQWIQKLEEAAGKTIGNYASLLEALESRIRYFNENGCRVSDHALDFVPYAQVSEKEVSRIFAKALHGEAISPAEDNQYRFYTLHFMGGIYAELNWAMELHINTIRNVNTRMFQALGPDTGFDCIHDSAVAAPLTGLLDSLEKDNALPKTILYSLNPNDFSTLGSIIGCFQGGGIAGKMQLGAAWWYNDTKDGMLKQMKALSDVGLLSTFLGMLTDSRSFLSYTRHEYFRRILCNMLGEWMENGEIPDDMEAVGGIVRDISYHNAKNYFGV